MFCDTSFLYGDPTGMGLMNDCAIFIVEVIGFLFIAVNIIILYQLQSNPSLKVFLDSSCCKDSISHDKKSVHSHLIEPLTQTLPQHISDINLSSNHSSRISKNRLFPNKHVDICIAWIESMISIATLCIMTTNKIFGCSQISTILNFTIRVIGWVLFGWTSIYRDRCYTSLSLSSKDLSPYYRRIVYLSMVWNISTIVTGAMNFTQYFDVNSTLSFSILILTYLTITILSMIYLTVFIVKFEWQTNNSKNVILSGPLNNSNINNNPTSEQTVNGNISFTSRSRVWFGILGRITAGESSQSLSSSSSSLQPSSSTHPIRDDLINNLWASHRGSDAYNTWKISNLDNNNNNGLSSSMVDVRLSDSGHESISDNTISSTTDIKIKIISIDVDGGIRIPSASESSNSNSNSNSIQASWSGGPRSTSLISNSWNSISSRFAKEQNHNNYVKDVTINVVEWGKQMINNRPVILYTLALTETSMDNTNHPTNGSPTILDQAKSYISNDSSNSNHILPSRTSKIIWKRLDEIIYLREKLLSDFTNVTDIPLAPMLTHDELESMEVSSEVKLMGIPERRQSRTQSTSFVSLKRERSQIYESHRISMSKYLELLIAHPLAGRLALYDFKNSVSSHQIVPNTQLVSNSSSSASVSNKSLLSKALNPTNNLSPKVSKFFPYFLSSQESLLEVAVVGWVDIQVPIAIIPSSSGKTNLSFTNKIFYEVEVRYNGNYHVLRKRFRQFRALYQMLDLQGYTNLSMDSTSGSIEGPLKFSLRRSRTLPLTKEDDDKFHENTVSLDQFMKTCIDYFKYHPKGCNYPSILLAFLESDISHRSYYWDVVLSKSIAISNPTTGTINTNINAVVNSKIASNKVISQNEEEEEDKKNSDKKSSESTWRTIRISDEIGQYLINRGDQVREIIAFNCTIPSDKSVLPNITNITNPVVLNSFSGIIQETSIPMQGTDVNRNIIDNIDVKMNDDGTSHPIDVNTTTHSINSSYKSSFISSSTTNDKNNINTPISIPTLSSTLSPQPSSSASKTSKLITSVFHPFGSSTKATSPTVVSDSNQNMSTQRLLELPGQLLDELVSLLQYIHSDELTDDTVPSTHRIVLNNNANNSNNTTTQQSIPSKSCKDYIPYEYSLLLDSRLKSNSSVKGVSTFQWISQFRVQNAIVSTTAFYEICRRMELLQQIPLKELATLTESIRLPFLLNLYNLMSLQASILLPWPSVNDVKGRIAWQLHQAKFKIGSGYLSLLQLEHGLIRASNHSMGIPSMFGCPEIPIPSIHDIKIYQNLALTVPEPRVSFAIVLPYQTSPRLLQSKSNLNSKLNNLGTIAYTYKNMKKCLSESIKEYIQQIVLYSRKSSHHIPLPKLFRIYFNDFNNYIPPIHTAVTNPYKSPEQKPISSKGSTNSIAKDRVDKSMISSDIAITATTVTEWDRIHSLASDRASSPKLLFRSSSSSESQRSSETQASNNTSSSSINMSLSLSDHENSMGDVTIFEAELQRIVRILRLGIDVRDRRNLLRSYKACFLGSDFIRCLLASGNAKSVEDAKYIGNLLILFDYIRHIKGEQWIEDDDSAYYIFTDYNPPLTPIAPYYSFLLAHATGEMSEDVRLKNTLVHAFENSDSIAWIAEDFSFCFPIPQSSSSSLSLI